MERDGWRVSRAGVLVGSLLVAALAVPASARSGSGSVGGRLRLPFDARFGRAVVAAGDYSFRLDSLPSPRLVLVRREGEAVVVRGVASLRDRGPSVLDGSAFVALRRNGAYDLRAFHLLAGGRSLVLDLAPETQPEPRRGARTPQLLQRVSVEVIEP